jgi:DHA1 family inner membrane transport protein
MTDPSPSRRWPALTALALGGFAVGLTEFAAMGLLPEIARGLLPHAYAHSSADAVSRAGWTVSAYALGVVAGAPTIAALTARVPRRRLVVGLLVLFVAGTAASALAPTFGTLVLARFVAGLPHGAYFGAAGMLASNLMGPGSQAKGFAAVLSGLTTANVVGVPLVTRLGQTAGWRSAYLAIAAVFLLTLFAVRLTVPENRHGPAGSPRAELRALAAPRVWMAAGVASVGCAGFFAVDSYIAPITTHVTGLPSAAVPWVLVAMGLGMTVGNAAGGWCADRALRRSMLLGFAAMAVALTFFTLAAHTRAGLFGGAFLLGAVCLFLGPALQARLIQAAPNAQLMGAAVNQSAMNVANSLGAALGGLVIAQGRGYLAPGWLGAALAAVGFVLAAVGFALDGREPRRAELGGQATA